ncbi:MAG: ATP-binding cassette domain-containing protein [Terriglobales bacterium]
MLSVAIRKQRRSLAVEAAFALAAGDALALFGRSGAGKTTILNCIAGLEQPDAGRIACDAQIWFPPPLPPHRRHLGYFSQQPCLFPHLNVADNVVFGLPRAQRRSPLSPWLRQLRARLALDQCWTAPVASLSGGQARRVALARMLAPAPSLLLLDEPFAGLDRLNVRDLLQALCEWRQQLGFTLVVVDHQPELLRALTGQVIYLDQGRMAAPQQSWDELSRHPDAALQDLLRPLGTAQPPMRTIARAGFWNPGSPM